MKRFRDENGKLTMKIEHIAAATLEEANAYYIDGATYTINGGIATCKRWSDERGNHIRFDLSTGGSIFCAPTYMGTYLPGVAGDGLEIIRA